MKCGSVAPCNLYCQTSNIKLDAEWIFVKMRKKKHENKISHPIKIVHEDFGLDKCILLWQGIEIQSNPFWASPPKCAPIYF